MGPNAVQIPVSPQLGSVWESSIIFLVQGIASDRPEACSPHRKTSTYTVDRDIHTRLPCHLKISTLPRFAYTILHYSLFLPLTGDYPPRSIAHHCAATTSPTSTRPNKPTMSLMDKVSESVFDTSSGTRSSDSSSEAAIKGCSSGSI